MTRKNINITCVRESIFGFKRLCQNESKRILVLIVSLSCFSCVFQSITLTYKNPSLFLYNRTSYFTGPSIGYKDSPPKPEGLRNSPPLNGSLKLANYFGQDDTRGSDIRKENAMDMVNRVKERNREKNSVLLESDDVVFQGNDKDDFFFNEVFDHDKKLLLQETDELDVIDRSGEPAHGLFESKEIKIDSEHKLRHTKMSQTSSGFPPLFSVSYHTNGVINTSKKNSVNPERNVTLSKNKSTQKMDNPLVSFSVVSFHNPVVKRKKKSLLPPMPISVMNSLFIKRRISSHPRKPHWSTMHDRQLVTARKLIESSPLLRNDNELHEPVFRNISMFRRSYELMEKILKVYVYKEGQKPIFHQPILKGIYASEGWFMKLMEGNKQFTVKDPRKAHLFYVPISTRYLQLALYVRGSHNRTNLAQYIKNYVNIISTKYSFWNRTGGSDHFIVACHDWAAYETRHNFALSIRAICNADVTEGFRIANDVSLPETYVRSSQNPLRDLGGEPASNRTIVAFYAGNMHGDLRTILLQYWENRDPNMKIYGPMPRGVSSKMAYIRHMQTSKYCICPRGYEVNSPRIMESIFYECVPVIISDNYVPPFFEVLNWESFAVFVAEKDVPFLKDILLSIPMEKYLSMQANVKKVQKHFLWHNKPMKYDLFHMILHSIWFNRLYQVG